MLRLTALPTLLAVAVLGIACGRSPFAPPEGTKVAVVPFSLSRGISVQSFDGDPSQVGQSLAEQIVEQLREDNHLDAVVVPNGATPQGDLIVRGEITHINGGNTAVRVTAFAAGLVAWPFAFIGIAGRADLGSQGSVTRSDGTVVGVFSAEKHGDGWSQRRAIANATDSLAEEFGGMIKDGKYEGGHPGNDGYLAATTVAAPSVEHLPPERLPAERSPADRLTTWRSRGSSQMRSMRRNGSRFLKSSNPPGAERKHRGGRGRLILVLVVLL